ncbi:hypothetical protein EZV62_000061 [Acer yangbiense]|uniref:ABC transporter domain-containing protein n=1 Tax=Acer yangbiense TaxID=1000413 RepID=A0A5C7ISV7_9ROSI|nr:hypothetical protein EZV62_000061 [Acer yangbiense]
MELTTLGTNIESSSFTNYGLSHIDMVVGADSTADDDREDEEIQLQWAAIERLPTFKRLRTSLFEKTSNDELQGKKLVTDVTKLGGVERRLFIEKLINHTENDNLKLLQGLKERIDRVNVELPTVEVRYNNVSVEAECEIVQGKPLPTLWNSLTSSFSVFKKAIKSKSREAKISILKDVNGIIKPSRLTLLLGPPGCGKTTLLLALAGKLDHSLKATGYISYNGYRLDEFVPKKTCAYISQYDLHIPEMTVRETIDFSARCQGVGSRADIMMEVSRKEKEAGIVPDPDVDTYMKAISVEGQKRNLQTDYVLKILGLDICADTIVGTALRRGVSGGQKKRLTTGEMIVGPTKALFMDEISTGLDSSTTFQIVTHLQQLVHITDATALVSLLQPAPETFNLFDDVILMAEGMIVYHGPCSYVLQYFEDCGFKCPKRKGVTSKKDQAQYWCCIDHPYSYVSADQFSQMFKASHLGKTLDEELSKPYDKSKCHSNALSFSKYSLGKWELFKACMSRELLLMKRNPFVHVFKTAQLVFTAFMAMTAFICTQHEMDLKRANYLMGSMYYSLVRLMTNGIAELSLNIIRLPVVHKQRAFCLFPAWAYCIPASLLKIPLSLFDAFMWTTMTYYVIGYSPDFHRFFFQFLLLFALNLASTSCYRFIASIFQTMVVASTAGFMTLLLMFLFGGFILPRYSLPAWLRWGFWISPMTYGEIGLSINEFLAPRWQRYNNDEASEGNTNIGRSVLASRNLEFDGYFYWISLGALLGFILFFDLGSVLALTYLKPPKMSRAIISTKRFSQLQGREDSGNNSKLDNVNESTLTAFQQNKPETRKVGRLALPFEPLTITFKDVQYYVDTPPEMKKHVDSNENRRTDNLFRNARNNEQDLFNLLGSLYTAVIFLGINNCSSAQPYVATERTVLYRENFAGMYSPWAYSFAQVTIEVPYLMVQSIIYVAITYPMIGFYWSVYKVVWYFYAIFCTFLYFVYLGMMIVSICPNFQVVAALTAAVYTMLNLFSGFLMPGPQIPKWWIWSYWICPTSWSLNGLFTSQYGDIDKEIMAFGELKTVGSFLQDYYGFQHDQLSLVAIVLIAFPIAFASLFAYFIGKLNFQRR